MKIRPSVFYFIIIMVLLIALVLWREKKAKFAEMPPRTVETNAVLPAIAPNIAPVSAPAHSNTPAAQSINTSIPAPPVESKDQQMREDLAKYNNPEIFFRGLVVDQLNAPVTGATVSGIIQANNGTRVGTDRMSTTTDGNGLFTISGYKGKNLGIHVVKSGYVMVMTNTSFVYSSLWPESQIYVPDPNNPTVIKMWQLQGAEPLASIRTEYRLPFTNAPIFFDLIAGKVVATGGDVKITINRPNGIISQKNPQNWSIDFTVVAGGFIDTSGRESSVTYEAPENGYQTDGIFGNNNGPDLIEKTFFITSRNGQIYSKVYLLFGINATPDGFMDITFSGVANTNSSRNWEATAPQ